MAPLPIALLLGAVAVGLRLLASRRSGADREKLAEISLLERYVRLPAHALPPVRLALLGAGVVAIALASGSGGTEARRLDEGGAETILVLDASNSMLAGDVEPSRLEVQRQLAARLATRTQGRMGVVYFAGRAYVLSPLTTDMSAIEMLAEGVRPAAVGLGGSSLASGLTQAIDLLAGGEEGARKSIVVLSDGEETAGAPLGEAIGRGPGSGDRHSLGGDRNRTRRTDSPDAGGIAGPDDGRAAAGRGFGASGTGRQSRHHAVERRVAAADVSRHGRALR